ncbi:ABC transporter ATP-binding protein [Ruania albidiflava]|uniref:ABC transporter ATP-binding protein n=1 Tax=Ruania albidiflava TaxID=366586 RepID=UPI0003B3DDF9|nr:ABC transporter ATP-binding protein [Ruania albidiflava]
MTTRSALTAHNLVKTYGTAGVLTPALAGVSLTVGPGGSLAVMGPSGSGKTTLLHCLAGVLAPISGQVLWAGQDLTALSETARTGLRRTDFGFVFQSGQLLPELPADENAALPLMLAGVGRAEATDIARRWLAYLGLAGMEGRRPGELSGGQAQRVAIARALVGSPGVVFADEPTGALDQQTGYEVLQVLTEATRATGAALVIVTHDPQVAAWCSRTVHMRDGRVVADTADGAAPAGLAAPPGVPHPGGVSTPPQEPPSNAPAGGPTQGEGSWPAQATPSWTAPMHTPVVPR